MDSQEVGGVLQECLAAAQRSTQPTEAERLNYCRCRDSLCAELASLLQEAVEMKWPFVPEKWQYKQSVGVDDKTNLSDLVGKHLSRLLAVLKASIVAREGRAALAAVFLVDRFLYWTDESSRLLKITKLLHRRHPGVPVAPQLVMRNARLHFNSGKLQKAESILSSLINNSGATGCWVYHHESDRALVQAVGIQVRGTILQKLGLWLEAAELIWASLVCYYALPQPDKKGIGTSLGILANILVSMNDKDFHAFRTNPDIDLSLLGERSHRLLSAAQAAKMAVVYSQYTSLYVLTNVATQGTCLLSYTFSVQCPASQRQSFLLQAREAFSIGLLTKAEGQLVTSKQELHAFLKAAYSLAVVHKWLGTPPEVVAQATQASQRALANFYDYCKADARDKKDLCAEIMRSVAQVKQLLRVEPFLNSDEGSFIPDSYRDITVTSVQFTLEGFAKVTQRLQKYRASLCETTVAHCRRTAGQTHGEGSCISATVGTLDTGCSTETCKVSPGGEEPRQKGSKSTAVPPPQRPDLPTTRGSTDNLGSSWQNFSLSGSGSLRPSSSVAVEREGNALNQRYPTTEDDDDDDRSDGMLHLADGNQSAVGSQTVPRPAPTATSSSNAIGDSEKFEVFRAGRETLGTDEIPAQTLSQLALGTPPSGSLSDSSGSQSSWVNISADLHSPTIRRPAKAGSSESAEVERSFFLLETLDFETDYSARDPTDKKHTSGDLSRPRPLESPNGDLVSVKAATKNSSANPQLAPEQCASTEPSTGSSFEVVEEHQSGDQRGEVAPSEDGVDPLMKNPVCYSCLKLGAVADVGPGSPYVLTQQDYQALLAGVCHDCLLKRLHSDGTQFKLKTHRTAHSALQLKFSKATGLWTARETCAYIGEPIGVEGKQREAIWVQFLHQEERLSSYVGKDYLKPKEIQVHLKDVERQMTAQHYVTAFNKSLYDKEVMAQIFFIPSEALLILSGHRVVGCVTVEPYMLGDFVKLTNNTVKKDPSLEATEYGLAFGHFTCLLSDYQEVVVDLQGWVTANGKGLTYLTDPQIHSTRSPRGPSNYAAKGLRFFLEEQHGPECNAVCRLLRLPALRQPPHLL
ncbi:alpha-protein kinase 1 isoform X2 [Pseudoliparis swirei]|uniref:alpha-protein kinase 1 isoform X2 n=1 Tax=Pseudoliparis swirei TaxID=2059687 RepID=UPI0024BEE4E1|nr:alpha-protein kinase 1 isoform X2 [Pseudoliparis swirei]